MDENMTQNNMNNEINMSDKAKKACRGSKGKMIAILVLSILLAASVTLNVCGLVRGHGMKAARNDRIEQFDGGQMPGGCAPGGIPGQLPGDSNGPQGQMPGNNGSGPQGQMPGGGQDDQNSKDKKTDDKTQNKQQDNKSTDEQKSTM